MGKQGTFPLEGKRCITPNVTGLTDPDGLRPRHLQLYGAPDCTCIPCLAVGPVIWASFLLSCVQRLLNSV